MVKVDIHNIIIQIQSWHEAAAESVGGLTPSIHSGGHSVPHLTPLQVMRRPFGRGMDGVIANEGAM